MNERKEHNRLKCCERCGEPPALCGCWSTDNDLIGRLRQQLAEKEQDFQVVKLAVIETEGRCAEFKAMLDDTLKQEFAVRQQLAEARAEVERQKQCVERREEMRRAVVDELGELRATLDACTVADTLERMAGEEHESRLRQWLAAEQSKRQLLENQLAAQAAELERLRDAAEKSVTAFEHYQMTCREHRSPYIKENGRYGASPYAELVESCQALRAAVAPSEKESNP